MYSIKEFFYTLQGEGAQTGRAAVFCRFAGCNLWNGQEADRANAVCNFCDTNFVGTDGQNGGKFLNAEQLVKAIAAQWKGEATRKLTVLTGGEPLLQVDTALIEALHNADFEIAVETNGTQHAPEGLDWICVSPKANSPLIQISGDELKLVYPQLLAPPARFENLNFTHFFLQPMDTPDPLQKEKNIKATIEYCLAHPQWRLSMQTHKWLGID